MRRLLVLAAVAAFVALARPQPSIAASKPTPRVAHVWIFVFENTTYDGVTPQSMPYFTSVAKQGVTLTKMYGVGHFSPLECPQELANLILGRVRPNRDDD